MKKETEMLDALEKMLIIYAKSALRDVAHIEATDEEAKNLIGKIGVRIIKFRAWTKKE